MSAPRKRAGDVERRAVQERLRDGYAQGALTVDEFEDRVTTALSAVWVDELRALVDDLPEPRAGSVEQPARAPDAPRRDPIAADPVRRHAASDDLERSWWSRLVLAAVAVGAVVVLQPWDIDQLSVFSSSTVRVEAGEEVRVAAVFGSTAVVVVDDAVVDPSVVSIFGSSDCGDACSAVGSASDEITVDGFAIFGSVDILTTTEARADT